MSDQDRELAWLGKVMLALGGAGLLVVLGAVGAYAWIFTGDLSRDQGTWGAFGDYIGGATGPILSLLALAALLLTIQLQLKELHATREELEKSTKALKAQSNAMNTQILDNAFFSQLRLLNDIVNAMDLGVGGNRPIHGRDCFAKFRDDLTRRANGQKKRNPTAEVDYSIAYEQIYRQHESDLGHYFRTLYNIVRFVDEKALAAPLFYIRLLRAQLSGGELFMLFYNGLSVAGANFKPLIEKYALLDNLRDDQLPDTTHKNEYEPSAFSTADVLEALADNSLQSDRPSADGRTGTALAS